MARAREARARHAAAAEVWDAGLIAGPLATGEIGEPSSQWLPTSHGEVARDVGLFDLPIVGGRELMAEVRSAAATRLWHERRARGQVERFDRLRSCGTRSIVASCSTCGEDRRPIAEGCGVRRVCGRCDVEGAIRRRARFGRARGRALLEGERLGWTRQVRKGGRYTEKMLTLTLPHATKDDARGEVAAHSRDTVSARIVALWRAWPRFLRFLNRWWKTRRERGISYHRAFEWTPGTDSLGHPHFHVYLYCPWIPRELVREWWAVALLSVGWPVGRDETTGASLVMVDVRMLRSFNRHAAEELMKGGRRSALTLSRIECADGRRLDPFETGLTRARCGDAPGLDAFDYSEGWTMLDVEGLISEECRAALYMALEGRRLSQASRGFFVADEPATCLCCGATSFVVRFELPPLGPAGRPAGGRNERAPP